MKVSIIYNDHLLVTKLNHSVKVSELLYNLTTSPKLDFSSLKNGYELKLMDENEKILDDSYLIKFEKNDESKSKNQIFSEIENERRFHLIALQKYRNKLKKDENLEGETRDLEELIMKVTDAKTKIKAVQNNQSRFRGYSHFNANNANVEPIPVNNLARGGAMRELLQSMMANSNLSQGSGGTANLQQILNTLLAQGSELENSLNVQIGGGNRQSNNSSLQVEPNENMLKDLKEMGFPEDACRRALIMSRNNLQRATDILLNDELDFLPQNNAQNRLVRNNQK
jgi:hypothetical protein